MINLCHGTRVFSTVCFLGRMDEAYGCSIAHALVLFFLSIFEGGSLVLQY